MLSALSAGPLLNSSALSYLFSSCLSPSSWSLYLAIGRSLFELSLWRAEVKTDSASVCASVRLLGEAQNLRVCGTMSELLRTSRFFYFTGGSRLDNILEAPLED